MGREVDGEGSSKGKRRINFKAEKAKSILARCCKRPKLQSILNQKKKKKQKQDRECDLRFCNPNCIEIGDTVDILDLLFSPDRDFLLKNNGHKVRVDELKGKTIVLYMVPLHKLYHEPWVTLDMVDAYNELLPMGDVKFVFVAAQMDNRYDSSLRKPKPEEEEVYFNHLFSTIPFPTIPFSDYPARQRFVKAFRLDTIGSSDLPYWCIIDPTNTVVSSNRDCETLFNMYGGAELYPLTRDRLCALSSPRYTPRKHLNNLDQLLASPTRDFLLSSNGLDKVPISSLKDKVIGLYFCVNKPNPPRMQLINKVYQEAKLCGYDFEIVQINFHFHHSPMVFVNVEDLSVPHCYQNINWLTLPFKDPSCRKLHRIFECSYDPDDSNWSEDCLVIVDCRQPDINGVRFEFSGAEIIEQYGIEGYPFIRESLYELEWKIQKESVKLKLLFPPGECQLIIRRAGDGCDLVDGSQLSGKRVLVLFASHQECKSGKYVSMLASKYHAQLRDAKEDSKFEVVYVSSDPDEMLFDDCIKDMPPWLVYPHSRDFAHGWKRKILKCIRGVGLVAFDVDGELMAKKNDLNYNWRLEDYHKLPFPYISPGLEHMISSEVDEMCKLYEYYDSSNIVSEDSDDDI